MLPHLPFYSAYKRSGVDWLGNVPAHWEVVALKRIGRFTSGAGFPVEEQGRLNQDIPFFKVSDMNLPGNSKVMGAMMNSISHDTAVKLGATVYPSGTIIFPKVGGALLTNKRRVINRPSCIDNNLMGCVVQRGDPRFILLLLENLDLGTIAKPGPVPAISEGEVREIRIVFPPLPEQRAIARYLDHADRRIQRYIETKEKLIALLQEARQATIQRAVTRGLDPDMPLKPSGVDWLGDVPAHWKVKKASRLFSIGSGTTPPTDRLEYYGGEIPWITTSELRETVVTSTVKTVTEEALKDFPTLNVYPEGSIAVAMYGATIGRLGILGIPATVNQACCVFSNPNEMYPQFWFYWLQSRRQYLTSRGLGGGQPNLSQKMLRAIQVPVPPLPEQRAIAAHLDIATANIDAAIDSARRQADLMREYRASLIAHVVTGKLDVRAAAANLPAH